MSFELDRIELLLGEMTPTEALVADAAKHLPDGIFVRSVGIPGIYRIEDGRKRGFPTSSSYVAQGGRKDTSNVDLISDNELYAIPDRPMMPGT